jgi:hypothetical protein
MMYSVEMPLADMIPNFVKIHSDIQIILRSIP